MRKYEGIWLKLKDAKPGQWVEVTVRRTAQIQTIINMVQLEKSKATVARRQLRMPEFGRLEINREPDKLKVSFRLSNPGHLL